MARPRSVSAHQKVVKAALDLMAERGLDATSMDAIADSSGVSKATIYKHWPDKEALMLEVMADMHGLHARPEFDSGNVRNDLVAVLAYRPEANAQIRERIMPHFMAYSARNPTFGQAWRNMVMEPPRRELRHLLEKGMAAGELSGEIDIDLALAVLIGPIIYWFVFLRYPDTQPGRLAECVVDCFWRAWSTKSRPAKR